MLFFSARRPHSASIPRRGKAKITVKPIEFSLPVGILAPQMVRKNESDASYTMDYVIK